jgi:cell wall assembly regulator SMI1
MNKFLSSVQSFIHSVTTNDHYASYESTYKTRTHESLNQDPSYSPDESSRVVGNLGNGSSSSLDRLQQQNGSTSSLNRVPYTPGLRSQQIGNGGIPLQDYADGAPPPPAAALSWKRIDRWIESNYAELYDQLSYEVTAADLNELEADLDCTLPLDVRDSYMVHDGQERGGKPTGLFFGITLLDLEGIAEEWGHWKNTAIRLNNVMKQQQGNGPGTSRQPQQPPAGRGSSWLYRQESVPDGAIQKVYAHPGWIPLAKDFEGNNIGIDLAPGPKGRWGQVIIFGREFDRKYVVAPSWGAFLNTFADDLENGDHYIDDDLDNAALLFRAPNGKIIPYFDVLRSRVDRTIRQQKRQQHNTQPSAAATSRKASRPTTPSQQQQSLISPMHSTTNLPATGLSTSSNPSAKNSLDTSRSSTTSKHEEETNNNNNNNNAKDGQQKKESTATTTTDKGKEKEEADVDEVDMLKDELTEVEI